MRDNKLHTPDGMMDYLPGPFAFRTDVERRMEAVFHRYGYESVASPMFEYIEVLEGNGSVSPAQMYRFTDRDGRTLALRSDMTPPIARIAATAYDGGDLPLRFCYIANAFREHESYQGKLNEFTQAGVELIGAHSPDATAEVVAVAVNSLLAAGASSFRVDIGQIGFIQGVMDECSFDEETRRGMQDDIMGRDYVALEERIRGIAIPPGAREIFSGLALMIGGEEIIQRARKLTASEKAHAALTELERLHAILRGYGADGYVSFDLSMLGHLDYYTGVIFRGYMRGTGSSVLGGGQYDGLLSKFGKNYPAVGFSLKLSALLSILDGAGDKAEPRAADTLVSYTDEARGAALGAAEELRAQGLCVVNSLLGGDFQTNRAFAEQRGIGGLLHFMGDGQVRVADIRRGTDETVDISALAGLSTFAPRMHPAGDADLRATSGKET